MSHQGKYFIIIKQFSFSPMFLKLIVWVKDKQKDGKGLRVGGGVEMGELKLASVVIWVKSVFVFVEFDC